MLGLCLGISVLLSAHWVCVEGSSERFKDGHSRFVSGRAFGRYTRSEKWEEVWVGLFFLLLWKWCRLWAKLEGARHFWL